MSKKPKGWKLSGNPIDRVRREAELARQRDELGGGARQARSISQLGGDFDLIDAEQETDAPTPRRHDAKAAILGAAFDAAIPPDMAKQLRHRQAVAAVIRVPTLEWVGPAERHFVSHFGRRWVIDREHGPVSSFIASEARPDVAAVLSRGHCVAGIAADVSKLPTALTATADFTIQIEPVTGRVLRAAIARFTGRNPGVCEDALGAGCDFNELRACFRPGTGPQRIVERIAAVSKTKLGPIADERVPDLEHAVEFGAAARDFALALKRDLAAIRAGEAVDLPRGLILMSDPGVGKNTYGKALARFCNLPFCHTSVSAWFEGRGFLHDVIQRMNAAFDQALAMAPSLLYWDEVSSLPRRDTLDSHNRDFWIPVIDGALIRLDGMLSSQSMRQVVVVAATNDASRVDPALARPGRLERVVHIPRPDVAGIQNILRFHLHTDLLGDDLGDIAAIAQGATGADLMAMVRSARQAARHAGVPLSIDHLRSVLLPRSMQSPDEFQRACIHEAAHAVAAVVLGLGKVDVIVGAAFGDAHRTFIQGLHAELPTRETFRKRAIMYLAARAAEAWLPAGMSAGSGGGKTSDLAMASREVAAMNFSAGLGDTLVCVASPDQALEDLRYDPEMRRIVDAQLHEIQKEASGLVEKHRDAVLAVALSLNQRRHLDDESVRRICRGFGIGRRKAAKKGGST